MVAPLVDQLTALGTNVIIHSDVKRTRAIALLLAEKLGIVPIAERRWRERDFGAWEGQSWSGHCSANDGRCGPSRYSL